MKNKNRLEREWEALCSYQAEPSASCVGRGEQNSKRNRSDTVVACECILFLEEGGSAIYKGRTMQAHNKYNCRTSQKYMRTICFQ